MAFAPALIGLAQTTYYVANAGSDPNDGRSPASPFQGLDRINRLALQPGDVVLFRRGDTFRGTLQVRQSGNGPVSKWHGSTVGPLPKAHSL